ncbi:hypothetical protein AWM75_06285 [Aerococcus urinaehominis]|uniref:Uncharacterized protein n=1 Tax=Aerococcus urinaehominis TaxID=128944 RepID=A0A0X8FLN8_9LACT|nr:primosomal protein DnaI [Aerococcus urinaehominis]AMB99613.1 hypothetical protein AWM75_06285 [Aerococcus urinaehominis]SDL87438.1 primosomal protein DnaI [Aerococcus urinaehominis]
MKHVGKAMKEELSRNQLSDRLQAIYQQVLADTDVKQFIAANKDQLSQPMIDRSMSKLYEFTQAKKRPASEFTPRLFMNVNYIDVNYQANDRFYQKQAAREKRDRLELIQLPDSLRQAVFRDFRTDIEGREQALIAATQCGKNYQSAAKQSHKGIYLHGSFGVGKTYLLAALANYLVDKGAHVLLVHYPTELQAIKNGFADNSAQTRINRLKEVEVLMLDDIGAEANTAWTRDEVLSIVMQHRMQEEKLTCFSSNFAMAELEMHLANVTKGQDEVKAARIMERIRFLADEIMMSGPNLR